MGFFYIENYEGKKLLMSRVIQHHELFFMQVRAIFCNIKKWKFNMALCAFIINRNIGFYI